MMEVTLAWKDHNNNLCGTFEKLFEESVFVDCTLAAEGKYVNVHKAILSAISPYFELLFTQECEENPIVILTDIKFQELKAIIDFIYRGKVKVSKEYLDDFLCAAESLQIKGLGRDYIKNQKQNGTAMTNAQEFSNYESRVPLNQHQVNVVVGNEDSGTAAPSALEVVDEDMDSQGHSAISSQTDPLNLETIVKCEPTSDEEVVKMEFFECKEEYVEEDASHCFSPSATTCNSTSSRFVTAERLQTDPLSSNAPNQSTSSDLEFDKADRYSLGPVSSQQFQGKGNNFLYLSTLPSISCIHKTLEINTEDVMPTIECIESCKEFVPEESAFDSEMCTSETAGAEEGEVDVEEAKVEFSSEEDVKEEEAEVKVKEEEVEVKVEQEQAEVDVGKEVADVVAGGWPSLACMQCGKVFGDVSQLSVHACTHTGGHTSVCHLCGKVFKSPSVLTRHLHRHTGERAFVCDICGKDFQTKDILKLHLRTHTGERPHVCSTCGKAFKQMSNLATHLRTHTGERPYACSTCGKAFKKMSHLANHLRTHTGERPYLCPTCGKAFAEPSTLNKHKRTHTGERPHVCSTCGKAFTQMSNLATHLRTHTGERPHVCPTCGKAFKEAGKLKHHLRTHTGERPFVCDICAKDFQTKETLKLHLRTHTGERPHVCPTCGKGFNRRSNLANHLRTHTGERP